MSKIEDYIGKLKNIEKWEEYLMQESGLPGSRANIELARAVAEEGNEEIFLRLLTNTSESAPANSSREFLAFCGTVGLGKLIMKGQNKYFERLRYLASDSRWRTREAVAIALQLYGEKDMEELIKQMKEWSKGNNYEKRAVVATLCEPKLLNQKEDVLEVLNILDKITYSITKTQDRKDESFKALKKGMGYCWSIAVVAYPEEGKKKFEEWALSADTDIAWIIKENLKKKRLERMDKEWTRSLKGKF